MSAGMLPDAFVRRLHEDFPPTVAKRVIEAYAEPPSISIRKHPIKVNSRFLNGIPVPWSKRGFLLEARPSFTHDPLFHAGGYYVQDASSMILETLLESIELSKDAMALDLCAAPGGKTTILLDYLRDGFVVANEIDPKRNAILRENLLKWGFANQAVTQFQSARWAQSGIAFDLLLIDAPCSGEGMFRKDAFAREQWTASLVDQCAYVQRNILNDAPNLVKEGGWLIYSTCTLNQKENEAQIESLLERGFEAVTPDLSVFSEFLYPALAKDGSRLGYYLLPGVSPGEGLFISVLRFHGPNASQPKTPALALRKLEPSIAEEWSLDADADYRVKDNIWYMISQASHVASFARGFKQVGLPVLEQKGKTWIPKHGLAMLAEQKPMIELDLQPSIQYLRKEAFNLPPGLANGWQLLGHENIPLGWIKNMPNRFNNYYPTELRIRN